MTTAMNQGSIVIRIAPVPLNLEGKNRLSSDWQLYRQRTCPCNECHGAAAITQFLPGSNRTWPDAVINPATYFGGGRDLRNSTRPAHISPAT